MSKPEYTNGFDKDVYKVDNASIRKKINVCGNWYEIQFNDQYFVISEEMLKSLAEIIDMPDNLTLSIG